MRVVVRQEVTIPGPAIPGSSSTLDDVVPAIRAEVPSANSDKERLEVRTRNREELAADRVFQALDTDVLVDEIVSSLVE